MPSVSAGASANHPLGASFSQCRPLVWQAAGISIFVNLLMLTGPLFMLQVYDRVLASQSQPTLLVLFALVAVLFGFYGLLEFFRGRLMARVGARLQAALDGEVFCASVRAARERDPGRRRLNALHDLENLQLLFSGPAPMAILDLPWSPLFFLVIYLFHWQLGALALAGAAVLVVLAAVNNARSRAPSVAAQLKSTEAENFERSIRSGAEATQALGMMAAATDRWRAQRGGALTQHICAADRMGAYGSAAKALRFLLQSAILAWGAKLAIDQLITPGMIIAASIMMGRALAPIDQTIAHWRVYARGHLAWRNLRALFEDHELGPVRTVLPPLQGRVRAQRLALAPPGAETPIVRGLTFDVQPGQALGVIGPTGCGKSALARTLVGLWPAAYGTLTLDGAALDQWSPDRLGEQIGYLPQDVSMIDATAAENIARLQPLYDDAAVIAAAKLAQAHDLIVGLPSGYDTMVGPSGTALSGGQRQRIGLARALFGDPALLVLDEPNAHLDAAGEKAVIEVIGALKAVGRSVVVMVHRPSAIAACDTLLVLAEGRQRAFGPRDKVLGKAVEDAGSLPAAASAGS